MNVLLTGANGFLGGYIKEEFSKQGDVVATMGRQVSDSHKADFQTNVEAVNIKYDIVVHAAGRAHSVPRTEEEKKLFYEINYKGTLKLLDALNAAPPTSFVFISTIAVYGLDEGRSIDEDADLNATEPYGLSKKMAEQAVIDWCALNHCKCCILRLPLLVGKNAPGNLGAMIKGIRSGKYFRIGKGEGRKSMVLAEDVAHIIPKAAFVGGIYNLTDGRDPSFAELENVLAQQLKTKIKIMPFLLAKVIAYVGSLINFVVGKRVFPLDRRAFGKITLSLTLNDIKARTKLDWKPKSVLQFLKDNIN